MNTEEKVKVQRKPRFEKGSQAAKEWSQKMLAAKAAKKLVSSNSPSLIASETGN